MVWFQSVDKIGNKMMRCGNLVLACVHCNFTCKQKDSSLEVRLFDWLHMESSCAYTSLTCNWCVLGFLDLKDDCFCNTSWKNDHICYRSCSETSWQDTWNLLHVWNHHTLNIYPLLLCAWFGSNLLKSGLWFLCSLEYLLWLFDLDLWECCFHLALLGGRSVL